MRSIIVFVFLIAARAQSQDPTHVMTGYVLTVQTAEDMTRASSAEVIHRVKLIVHELQKGTGYSPGNVLTFSYMDSVSNHVISERTIIRVFMTKNKFGQLSLASVRSWEEICH